MIRSLPVPSASDARKSALTLALLLFTGGLVAVQPLLAAALTGVIVATVLLAHPERLPARFVKGTGFVLAGYAFLGRGFAYLGQSPVFVGDVVLFVGVLALCTRARHVRLTPLNGTLVLFMSLGLLRTLPYVGEYKVDAIRDATLWGYGLYAIALSVFLTRRHFTTAIDGYRRLVPWLVAWVPITAALYAMHASPLWPNSGVPIIGYKSGDMGVQLTFAGAFVLLGLYELRPQRGLRSEPILWIMWCIGAAAVVAQSRSAMLICSFGLAAAASLRRSARILRFFGAVVAMVIVLLAINPSIPVGNAQRVSITDLTANAISIVVSKQDQGADATTSPGATHQDLQASKDFRLRWWKTIVNYTFNGPYFWNGKGFGINLADSDGFQVDAHHSLRAPHNSNMTVLARMGVPGLTIWVFLQALFAGTMLVWFQRARRAGARLWSLVDAWLFVAWLAMLVDTSFDPYLEGPQGAIWFWSVIGAGMAAVRMQREDIEAGARDLEASPA